LQVSLVQASPSSHENAVPVQTPFVHVSLLVHALPSVQGVVLGNPVQDVTGVLPGQPRHW
jgi:hypothetical protein